ncbi:MAG TPA: N-acyl homoserine lactonase family protein [Burkholderiales bacterium]
MEGTSGKGWKLAAPLIAAMCIQPVAQGAGIERMYVLDCGESETRDVSANWSPGVNVGKSRMFSDNCYLIRHEKGLLLWDSGIPDSVAETPEGVTVANGMLVLKVKRTLQAQLKELDVAPSQVTHLAFSHFHGDHVGNANLFTAARLYIQNPEFEAAFGAEPAKFGFNPAMYEKLRNSPMVKLSGDKDVFGDGSVLILSTPGHTPGHQSLLVKLPATGAVVLSGDATHFQDNWENRRVPARNFDKEQTAASMQKIANVLRQEKAVLWINHDYEQSAALPRAPKFLE